MSRSVWFERSKGIEGKIKWDRLQRRKLLALGPRLRSEKSYELWRMIVGRLLQLRLARASEMLTKSFQFQKYSQMVFNLD